MSDAAQDLSGLTIVIAGASSPAGIACARQFAGAGARVVAVGSNAGRLEGALSDVDGVVLKTCDLSQAEDVQKLAAGLREDRLMPDGLIHLVGGWRGGDGIAGQSDGDYDFLHRQVVTTLRNTSRAFLPDLAASTRGRLAIVSATAVDRPTAGNASYAAVKSAAEAWVRAIADQFSPRHSGNDDDTPATAAACIVVVKALVDDAMRAGSPERRFPGHTDVRHVATTMAGLFTEDAAALNGRRVMLADLP
ncbi:SDR family oxidoreductase [Arthrobacter sp. H5]|uniref:SDR family NAD(P)-dependent oxidoreductase n=1 Tax=Arthrobacter sp. H5 TaxID=1267973 RepID=UPI000484209D|nr:SDR family oxidoreductase [Arthrobacter sp. H5]